MRKAPSSSRHLRLLVVASLAISTACSRPVAVRQTAAPDGALWNPVAPLDSSRYGVSHQGLDGSDVFLFDWGGRYWLTSSAGDRVVLRSSPTIGGLADAVPVVVWQPGTGGAPPSFASNVWAPEFHRLQGPDGWHWYLYVGADPQDLTRHQILVLQSYGDDPRGPYQFKAIPPLQPFAIDPTVVSVDGRNYLIYSGAANPPYPQDLYIARLETPWSLAGPPVMISKPTFGWETEGIPVQEGPEALIHGPWLNVIYSTSFCAGPEYKLGRLTVPAEADLLDPKTWTDAKVPQPVFQSNPGRGVYGPGHGSFFTSLNGRQWWMAYGASTSTAITSCAGGVPRTARVQPIDWNADGTPNFGEPRALPSPLQPPEGDPTLARQFEDAPVARLSGGSVAIVRGDAFVGGEASEFQADGPGASVTYRVSVPSGATYHLLIRMATGPNFGSGRLVVNGRSAATTWNAFSPQAGVREFDLGSQRLPGGSSTFQFVVTGKAPLSTGYTLTTDQVLLR